MSAGESKSESYNSKVLRGHTGGVLSVSFSGDGRLIVSGSWDKTVRVWNAVSGECVLRPLQGHTNWVNSVSFSGDGKLIVSGSDDSTVRVWNAVSGECVLGPLQGHTHWVYSVSFSGDGKLIVSGSRDKTVRVWNVADEIIKFYRMKYNMPDIQNLFMTGSSNSIYDMFGKASVVFTQNTLTPYFEALDKFSSITDTFDEEIQKEKDKWNTKMILHKDRKIGLIVSQLRF